MRISWPYLHFISLEIKIYLLGDKSFSPRRKIIFSLEKIILLDKKTDVSLSLGTVGFPWEPASFPWEPAG